MKAKELRIGNLVDVYREDVHYGTIVIESITPYGVNERIGTYYAVFNKPMCDELLVKPITLTEEWLLKFGFAYDGEWLVLTKFETMFKTININTKISKVTISDGCIDDYEEIHLTDNIKYVHQLQNLYFALTNEELTIKND
jgi:hypothetical protein